MRSTVVVLSLIVLVGVVFSAPTSSNARNKQHQVAGISAGNIQSGTHGQPQGFIAPSSNGNQQIGDGSQSAWNFPTGIPFNGVHGHMVDATQQTSIFSHSMIGYANPQGMVARPQLASSIRINKSK